MTINTYLQELCQLGKSCKCGYKVFFRKSGGWFCAKKMRKNKDLHSNFIKKEK